MANNPGARGKSKPAHLWLKENDTAAPQLEQRLKVPTRLLSEELRPRSGEDRRVERAEVVRMKPACRLSAFVAERALRRAWARVLERCELS